MDVWYVTDPPVNADLIPIRKKLICWNLSRFSVGYRFAKQVVADLDARGDEPGSPCSGGRPPVARTAWRPAARPWSGASELAVQTWAIRRIAGSRAMMAAGTKPPRVIATMPRQGPGSTSRQASARESRCNWSQETGKVFCLCGASGTVALPLGLDGDGRPRD